MGTPFLNYDSYATPHGINVKPGGRVVAYVRSTGLQEGDDLFAATGNLYASINAACNVCKAGRGDIIVVLPGHTETHSVTGAVWSNLKAGTQIVGAFNSGGSSAPTVTLSHTGASIALNVADVTVQGLKILSSTAAVTGAIVVTAAGVTLEQNFIALTGALGANPAIAVTGAANFTMYRNHVVADCTDPIVEITGAGTTNFVIERNFFRQAQATSGGDYVNVADTAGISGFLAFNSGKTARALTTPNTGFDVDGSNVVATVMNVENYANDNVATGAVLANGATAA